MSAFVKMLYEFDWAGSEQGFRDALALSPGNADAYSLYGRLCAALGRHDEAVAMLERAFDLDPIAHKVDIATALLRANRADDAAAAAERAMALVPNNPRATATLAWARLKQGRNEEAIEGLVEAAALAPDATLWLAQLGQALALTGQPERAREILRTLETRRASPYHLAYVEAGLGEFDRAMDLLEEAVAARAGSAYGIKGSFLWAPLRGHPRFIALVRSMGLS